MDFYDVKRGFEGTVFAFTHLREVLDPFEVRCYRRGPVLHFMLKPRLPSYPHMVFSVKLLDDNDSEVMELRMLKRNPYNMREPSIFDENDRVKMLAKGSREVHELIAAADPFITAFYHYPDGIVARIHNDDGELKVGCNGFYLPGSSLPTPSLFSQIAAKIADFIYSEQQAQARVSEAIAKDMLDAAELISYHTHEREYGVVDPGVEYGWTPDLLPKIHPAISKLVGRILKHLPKRKAAKPQAKKKKAKR